MALQTTYGDTIAAGVAGALASQLNGNILSRTVEAAAISFGAPVKQGTGDHGVLAFGSGDTVVFGVAILDRGATGVNPSTLAITENAYAVGETARIVPVGGGHAVWVVCTSGCSAGDGVWVRPSNGTWQDSNANSGVAVTGARWETSAGAGELAIIRFG